LDATKEKADAPGLVTTRVPLDALHLDPSNARTHGDQNLSAIEASLARFGQVEPLLVQKGTGCVIGGNGRLVAMRKLGWTECDIVEADVDGTTATALGVALNRTAELATWDEETLGRLLASLRDDDALAGVGFDDADVDRLLEELAADAELAELDDPGPGDPPEEPVSHAGDLWLLGRHRLLCGDCRDGDALKRLMESQQANLVFTDPPYGVSIEGRTADALRIQNDDQAGLGDLLQAAFSNVVNHCSPGSVWYVAAPAGPQLADFTRVLGDLGVWRQSLTWVKNSLVLGHSDFHYRHETILYGWMPGADHHRPPGRSNDTVWEFDRPARSELHPTTKPVELVARAIELSSKPDDLVLDPFVGSGTTIIASEQLGRRCYAMDVDARYVDVAVQRWQEATGEDATIDGDGRAFDAVKAERSPS